MTRLKLSQALVCALLLFSLSAQAKQEGWPAWMQEKMAEETRNMEFREVTTGDEQFTFELPGKPGAPEAFDGGWYVATDIKADIPLECYIFVEENDLGTLLINMLNLNIQSTAANYEKEERSRALYAIDAGDIDGSAYLSLEMIYTLGETGQAIAGLSKIRVATKGTNSFLCSHNALGYRETFAETFTRFIQSVNATEPELPPYYSEVIVQTINDMNIGVTKMTMAKDDEGDSLITTTSASVIPISASDLSTSDSSSYAWSTPDGYLISANSADAENGELVTSMRVNRNDDGDWVSYGTFQGKPIEQVIDGEQAPHSDLGSMMLAKQLFAGEDASVSFTSWLPSADPTRFVDASISRSADMPEDVATISLGPIVVDGQFDEHGSVRQASMQMGPIQVLMERTWVDGTP